MIGEFVKTPNGLRKIKGEVGGKLLLIDKDGNATVTIPDRIQFIVDDQTRQTFERIDEATARGKAIANFKTN